MTQPAAPLTMTTPLPHRSPDTRARSLFTVADVAQHLPAIDHVSRYTARALGYRPRNRVLAVADLNYYATLIDQAPLRTRGRLRGLCGAGPPASKLNVIWAAPAPLNELFETLTHEWAHAVLPRSVAHTHDWLEVHLSALETLSPPSHVEGVRNSCLQQYQLD